MGKTLCQRQLTWRTPEQVLKLAPILVIAILIGPVLAGLAFIIAPAIGHSVLVQREMHTYSLDAFAMVLNEPGIGKSIFLAFWMGPVTALISLALVALFTASFSGTRIFNAAYTAFKPVLAMPHAAAAIGLAFLVAPSGFLVRLVSPELTGFTRPPDWLILNDPMGLSLMVGLVAKEMPFLFLVLVAALPQTDGRRIRVARAFGHGQVWAWFVSVFPQVYKQIRLPVYAVIAFASSVVDVALILGPGTPPPLSVRILRWMGDPDLSHRAMAAAAALLQLGITFAALITWWIGERLVTVVGRAVATRGWRFRHDGVIRVFAFLGNFSAALAILVGIGLLALWSIAGVWRFPDALPQMVSFASWMREQENLLEVSLRAITIATTSSLVALMLVMACLENEYRQQIRLSALAQFTLYLPLLVPQIAFLSGLSVLLLWYGIDGNIWSVSLAHLVFVLPYTYLVLADPWHSFDARYLAVGRSFGRSPLAVLLTIRLPILLRPIMTAFALGFAISIAQYLPTLLIGAGRQPTITTEAVALASGGNRRLIGVYALVQTLLPFAVFAVTALIPTILWRNRAALRPGYER